MSGKWPMLKAKKISSISILEAHTVTQHKPRRSPAHCRAPIGMPPPRGRRGANCAMTRRGGRGARWSGRGGDKGRARGGHAARVNKAYLFLRYCDSAWTPSKSTLPNRLRRPGRRAGVAVAVALQPKSPPGPRAVASAFALCVAVLDAACFAFAFVCRLFIEPTSQPGKASEQQQVQLQERSGAWPPQSAPRLARGTCAHPLPCHDGLPFLFPVTFNSFSFRASSACRTFSFSASCLLQETRRSVSTGEPRSLQADQRPRMAAGQ